MNLPKITIQHLVQATNDVIASPFWRQISKIRVFYSIALQYASQHSTCYYSASFPKNENKLEIEELPVLAFVRLPDGRKNTIVYEKSTDLVVVVEYYRVFLSKRSAVERLLSEVMTDLQCKNFGEIHYYHDIEAKVAIIKDWLQKNP